MNTASPAHLSRTPYAAMCLALCFATTSAAAAPEKAAVLPTSGSADADSRARLDVALRKALNKETALFKLQAAKDTGGHLSSMAELGVICDNTDIPCLQKLGIVAGVSRLLVVEASGKRALDVSITYINVDEGKVIRQTTGSVVLVEAKDSAEIITRVLNGEPAIPGILDTTTEATSPTSPSPATTTPTASRARVSEAIPTSLDTTTAPVVAVDGPVDETALNPTQFAGAVTAGTGGGVAVIGLLGALTSEAIFWTGTGPAVTRRDVIAPLGAVMWIASAVGVVAAAVGVVVVVVGSPAARPASKLDAE